ncbi:MAG: DUF1223 domain-containing protein [Pseudomonadota bacterium]
MKRMLAFVPALAFAIPGAFATPAAADAPVVVELFTSQGCSSCPPADEYLGELAGQPGVVALGWHVSYWDYMGWTDPFASDAFTQRQRDYAQEMGERMVYTPQMVIDGRKHAVGSDRETVAALIRAARADAKATMAVTAGPSGGWRVSITAGPAIGADVLWVSYLPEASNAVDAGENRGRKLSNYNIVRAVTLLGRWTGEAADYDVAADGDDGLRRVVLMQGAGGRIYGAAEAPDAAKQTALTPTTPRITPLPAGG